MERTGKKQCRDASYRQPFNRPQPELFEGINRAAKRVLIDRLAHWNYLSTWERGNRFVVKLRDLGEWELVYQACTHMRPSRRQPDLNRVETALFGQADCDLAWAFLAFVKATNRQPPNIKVDRLVEKTTELQASLFNRESLKCIAASEAFLWVYKPFNFPLGHQILLHTPQTLPYFFFKAKDYSKLVTSQQMGEQLSDEALLICHELDLGSKSNQLIQGQLKWRGWDKATIHDLQRQSTRAMIDDGQAHHIGSPLFPLEFALEYSLTPMEITPMLGMELARISDPENRGIRQQITRKEFTSSYPLTKDTWHQIAKLLDTTSLHRLARTCTQLYNLIHFERADSIWRTACEQEFPNELEWVASVRPCNSKTHHNMWLVSQLHTITMSGCS